jgi:hypothetical protein
MGNSPSRGYLGGWQQVNHGLNLRATQSQPTVQQVDSRQ